MVPGVLTLMPSFMVVKRLGLLNTRWVLILPYIRGGQVFAIFLLRAFWEAVPRDLFDAATVDGAPEPHILRHIVLPLSKPILSVERDIERSTEVLKPMTEPKKKRNCSAVS